jgi:dTDP-4-amino-4,6-dideoxygalactose transaminase
VAGVICPSDNSNATHVYWRYPIRIESPLDGAALDRVSNALRKIGARTAPRYTQKLAFEYGFLTERRMFGGSGFPFAGPQRHRGAELLYDRKHYPGAVAGLDRLLCIAWNERMDEADIDLIARTIREAVG